MASRSFDDILVSRASPATGPRPLRSRIAAFVPITVALLGVAVILLGGLPASKSSLAVSDAVDPIATGSIPSGTGG